MPVFDSTEAPADPRKREWWYNALDCCVTLEIGEKIIPGPEQETYNFELELQGVALDMMLFGFRIDMHARQLELKKLEKEEEKLQAALDLIAEPIWDKGLNPNSPKQLLEFFYVALSLPEVWISQKGVRKLSTNREALEKLQEYYIARPFINCIIELRKVRKLLSVFRYGVDPEGFLGGVGHRMRCTYNVCGTETGRWASSESVWGRGSNLQNITERARRMFIADEGCFLLYADGEQAESRAVGFIHGELFDDWTYLDVCEAGDLHTGVTSMVWLDLGWTGDPKKDKEIAEQVFYHHFTYRDMSKRGGHGTNYYGQPWTMAKHLKVDKVLIENFQRAYFKAFPAMRRWHTWVAGELGRTQSIRTFMGRERTFFGRANDDATLREAIAYEPQSAVGDIINRGIRQVQQRNPTVQPLAQIHDAGIFQIPGHPNDNAQLIAKVLSDFQVPVTSSRRPERTLLIPSEAKVGWNWSNLDPKKRFFTDGNPNGLRKWTGSDPRQRTEGPETPLLHRRFY